MEHTTDILTLVNIARVIQFVAMLGCSKEAFGVAENRVGRPKLKLWLWRNAVVLLAFSITFIAATIVDALHLLGPDGNAAAVNGIFWVIIFLHLQATRRAANRAPTERRNALTDAADALLSDMQKSKVRAAQALEQVHKSD